MKVQCGVTSGVLSKILLFQFWNFFFDRNKTLYDTIDGALTHLKHEK